MAFIERASGYRNTWSRRGGRSTAACTFYVLFNEHVALGGQKGTKVCATLSHGIQQMPQQWQLVRQMVQGANIQGNYRVIIQHCCHMETNWVPYILFSSWDGSVIHIIRVWYLHRQFDAVVIFKKQNLSVKSIWCSYAENLQKYWFVCCGNLSLACASCPDRWVSYAK